MFFWNTVTQCSNFLTLQSNYLESQSTTQASQPR